MYFNHTLSFTAALTQIAFFLIVWLHSSPKNYLFFIVIQCFSSWANVAYFTAWNRCVEKLKRTEISSWCTSGVHFINAG